MQNKNRLYRELQLTFPEIEQFLSKTDGGLYWHIVERFPHPQLVLGYDVNELAEIILAERPKNMGQKRSIRLAQHLRPSSASSPSRYAKRLCSQSGHSLSQGR